MTHRVLIVCDEPETSSALEVMIRGRDMEVLSAQGATDAVALAEQPLSAALLQLPQASGLDLLHLLREVHPDLPVVVAIPPNAPDYAAASMQAGAVDCVHLPHERARLLRSVSDACAQAPPLDRADGVRALIGQSPTLARTRRLLLRAATTDVTVLLLGESGTGKEIAARAIHAESSRRGGPFVPVNCGAIPEGLIESELFGHVTGAFTGATRERVGRFEQASGGSLFLDEVGELRLDLQVKLLRVLQDHNVQRVGSARSLAVDVRVLAASNRDLKDLVARGAFREDLYYRLAVFPVLLPPLRERGDDVITLARHFLARYVQHHKRPAKRLSEGAERALRACEWPGNVRELENVIERAVILEDSETLSVRSLPTEISHGRDTQSASGAGALDLDDIRPLADEERRILLRALERTAWNMKLAAKLLGIGRATIYRKVQKYGLSNPE